MIPRMLCARATLIAGPDHQQYKAGTAVRAVVFLKAIRSPKELTNEAFGPIAERGWRRIRIDAHKLLPDDHAFEQADSGEARAFRTALDQGIGVLVLGLVQ
jgi:hypothetical protein